uniref:glutathione transferase n=1 Tax=Jaculus jaculus TaxID=51337 RepID=A0A8C5KCZ9_JACJA
PDYDRSQWLSDEFKVGLDFPNLPYLINGAHKITPSNAILCSLASKHKLCGGAEEERIWRDILENQVTDNHLHLGILCRSSGFGLKKVSAYMKTSCLWPRPVYLKVAAWVNK